MTTETNMEEDGTPVDAEKLRRLTAHIGKKHRIPSFDYAKFADQNFKQRASFTNNSDHRWKGSNKSHDTTHKSPKYHNTDRLDKMSKQLYNDVQRSSLFLGVTAAEMKEFHERNNINATVSTRTETEKPENSLNSKDSPVSSEKNDFTALYGEPVIEAPFLKQSSFIKQEETKFKPTKNGEHSRLLSPVVLPPITTTDKFSQENQFEHVRQTPTRINKHGKLSFINRLGSIPSQKETDPQKRTIKIPPEELPNEYRVFSPRSQTQASFRVKECRSLDSVNINNGEEELGTPHRKATKDPEKPNISNNFTNLLGDSPLRKRSVSESLSEAGINRGMGRLNTFLKRTASSTRSSISTTTSPSQKKCHSVEDTLQADEEFKDFSVPQRSLNYYDLPIGPLGKQSSPKVRSVGSGVTKSGEFAHMFSLLLLDSSSGSSRVNSARSSTHSSTPGLERPMASRSFLMSRSDPNFTESSSFRIPGRPFSPNVRLASPSLGSPSVETINENEILEKYSQL